MKKPFVTETDAAALLAPFPPVISTAYAAGAARAASGSVAPISSSVPPEELRLLYDVVRALRPTVTCEIGFALGMSAVAICQGLEDNGHGHHHVIDPYERLHYRNFGLLTVSAAKLSHRMTFYEQFPESVLPGLSQVDFAFIDASHLFDLTIAAFTLIDNRLAVGGVLGFHDMWLPAQQKVARYILANRNYRAHPANLARVERGWKDRLLAATVERVPHLKTLLHPHVLTPWRTLGLGNLALFEKTSADDVRPFELFSDF